MSQQAPKLVSNTHYCVVGDVSVDSSAAIAPGVVLQAASGSRIVINKGVCLAAGVCVQSRKGILNIAEGVSLGANVLVIGSGDIGANTCVSAGSTLINPSIAAEAILPPDTLSGDFPRPASQQSNSFRGNSFRGNSFRDNSSQPQPYSYSSFQTHQSVEKVSVQSSYAQSPTSQTYSDQNHNSQNQNHYNQNGQTNSATDSASSASQIVHSSYDRVYGREQVTKLISALFPNRQPPNG